MSHSINRVLVFAVTVLVGFLAAGRSFAGAPDYIIDLVAAVPFACAAAYLARLHFKLAAVHLAAVLAWLFAIRFATPAMAAHPYVLRALALVTLAIGAQALADIWHQPPAIAPECARDLLAATENPEVA